MTRTRELPERQSSTLNRAVTKLFMFGLLLVPLVAGCASVEVTKTAKGFFEPTRPGDVEILMSIPNRPYVELATVSTTNWDPEETAKMHNALRAKSAPLGADAVVITDSGIVVVHDSSVLWSTGFALRYESTEKTASESR